MKLNPLEYNVFPTEEEATAYLDQNAKKAFDEATKTLNIYYGKWSLEVEKKYKLTDREDDFIEVSLFYGGNGPASCDIRTSNTIWIEFCDRKATQDWDRLYISEYSKADRLARIKSHKFLKDFVKEAHKEAYRWITLEGIGRMHHNDPTWKERYDKADLAPIE